MVTKILVGLIIKSPNTQISTQDNKFCTCNNKIKLVFNAICADKTSCQRGKRDEVIKFDSNGAQLCYR